MKTFLKKVKFNKPLVILGIGLLVLVGVLLYLKVDKGSVASGTLETYAQNIVAKCASSSYKPTCYEDEVPKLMETISMEQAFEVTALIQQKDTTYQYCHVLAHKLSSQEVKKNPSKWADVAARAPTGICSNGGIHGAFTERFRTEDMTPSQIKAVKPEIASVCEKREGWNPTGLVQGSCYHALGHLTMYITRADINSSVNLCRELAITKEGANYTQVCYDGVFMQIFQPLEPEDFALIRGKVPSKESLVAYCSQYASPMKDSCWTESWPMKIDSLQEPKGLTSFCSFHSESSQTDRCYLAVLYALTAQFNFDSSRLENYCQGLTGKYVGECFAHVASRFIENDSHLIKKAVDICKKGESLGVGESCYEELLSYSTYNFHAGSKEFYELCNQLIDPWKDQCLANKNVTS